MIIKTSIPGLADSLVIPLQNKVDELNKEIINLNKTHEELIKDLNNLIEIKDLTINDQLSNIAELNSTINNFEDLINYLELPIGTLFKDSQWEGIPQIILDKVNREECKLAGTYISNFNLSLLSLRGLANLFDDTKFGISPEIKELTITIDALGGNSSSTVHYLFSQFNPLYKRNYPDYPKVTLNLINTSNVTHFNGTFNAVNADYFFRIKGVDFKSCYSTYNFIVGNWVNYIEIFNIGYSPDCTSLSFSEAPRWGNETAGQIVFEGGKQSLIDSLITYSFDRASAGYKACTLRLGSFTKTYLTDEEIALITAKGFTIA